MSITTTLESKDIDQENQEKQVHQNASQALAQTFADRFNRALDKGNFPSLHFGRQREVALRFNVTRSAARKWVTGICLPDVDHLITICNELGVTIDYLVGRDIQNDNEKLVIPLLVGEPSALLGNSKCIGQFSFGEDVIRSAMRLPPNGTGLYLITTDSMQPLINLGDIAFLDMSVRHLEDGSIYLFGFRDRILLRRITLGFDDQITLSCLNKIYPEQKLSLNEIQIGDATKQDAKLRLIASIKWTIRQVGGGIE